MLFLALGDAKVPDARYFAFWWNIGFILSTWISRLILFSIEFKNIHLQGTVSQIFYLGLSCHLMIKIGQSFVYFQNLIF